MQTEIKYNERDESYEIHTEGAPFPEVYSIENLLNMSERYAEPVLVELIRYVKEHHRTRITARATPTAPLGRVVRNHMAEQAENASRTMNDIFDELISNKPKRDDPISVLKRNSKKI